MAKKKPIPPQPKEISQSQINPYLGTKPGFSDEKLRGEQISRKDDIVKDFSIGLQDIDESILFYFNNVIKPTVVQAGDSLKVPIVYGAPERWASVQKDGFYRDKDQKILVPLIMFKRDSLEKVRNIGNKLDGNEANLYHVIEKTYTQRNQYDRFSVLNNKIPQKEFYATVIPDYVNLTYNCIIWTNYVEQMNKIVEAINYASDSYWGDKNRFKFRASINNFNTITELTQGEDRAVKTTFNIIMNGYILPDSINKYLSTKLTKYYGKCKVIINFETANNLEEFNATTTTSQNKRGSVGIDSYNVNSIINTTTTEVNPSILTYLNTNKSKNSVSVTSTTATFNASFLTAPSGLPATSISNFTFFINGQLIENAALVSFVDNGNGTCTLTIDPVELEFSINTSLDEFTAIGKFA